MSQIENPDDLQSIANSIRVFRMHDNFSFVMELTKKSLSVNFWSTDLADAAFGKKIHVSKLKKCRTKLSRKSTAFVRHSLNLRGKQGLVKRISIPLAIKAADDFNGFDGNFFRENRT